VTASASAHPRAIPVRLTVAALAALGLLTGCAATVNGQGSLAAAGGPSGAASSPDFPGPSPANSGSATGSPVRPSTGGGTVGAAAAPTPCPHVTYPAAKLAFDCFGSDFQASTDVGIWPLRESKIVEPSTKWVVEEGAGHWGPSGGHTLGDIAKSVRTQMITEGGYGSGPTVSTLADEDTRVDGAAAHLLHTRFTINPSWAKANQTSVKQEQLWILAIKVGPDDVSLWYTSIPNLVSDLWPKVASIIKTIKVG
jgi:hypothetical protein